MRLLPVLFIFSIFGCKPIKYDGTTLPEKYLQFGNGGGFTSAVTTYTLLPNGQLFKTKSLTNETTALPSIQKQQAKRCFKQYQTEILGQAQLNDPSNLYYFISDGKQRWVWGSNQAAVSPSIEAFYQTLHSFVKK